MVPRANRRISHSLCANGRLSRIVDFGISISARQHIRSVRISAAAVDTICMSMKLKEKLQRTSYTTTIQNTHELVPVKPLYSTINICHHRYQQGDAKDAHDASTFHFSTKGGSDGHTEGQWFTVLKYQRADGVRCNVLLVDSEGSGDKKRGDNRRKLSYKLFTVARMQSQVLIIRPPGWNDCNFDNDLSDRKEVADTTQWWNGCSSTENVQYLLSFYVGKNQCGHLESYCSKVFGSRVFFSLVL